MNGGAERAINECDVGDGACDGAHAHANRSGLERGPGGGGGADDAVAIADGDLAVGAEVDERGEIVAKRDARSDNAGENVGADKAADAAREADDAIGGQVPAEIAWGEALLAEMRRLEGHVRERLDVEPAKQVVHDGVADEQNFGNLRCAAACEARDDLTKCGADGRGEILALERSANAAHDVGAEGGLGIERGFDGEHVARGVDELRGDGGGAEIDGYGEAAR